MAAKSAHQKAVEQTKINAVLRELTHNESHTYIVNENRFNNALLHFENGDFSKIKTLLDEQKVFKLLSIVPKLKIAKDLNFYSQNRKGLVHEESNELRKLIEKKIKQAIVFFFQKGIDSVVKHEINGNIVLVCNDAGQLSLYLKKEAKKLAINSKKVTTSGLAESIEKAEATKKEVAENKTKGFRYEPSQFGAKGFFADK